MSGMTRSNIFLLLCVILGISIPSASSAKILAIFPFPARSHFLIFDSLLVGLANRGHNLTVVTPYPKLHPIPNYHEIDVAHCLRIPETRLNADFLTEKFRTTFKALNELIYMVNTFDKILACEPMVRLRNSSQQYDIVLTEMFVSYAMLGYVHKLNVPFVFFSSLPDMMPWASNAVALPDNPAYVPFRLSQYAISSSDLLASFYDRFYNTVVYALAHLFNTYKWIPRTDEIVRKHFGPTTPSVSEIAKKTSLVLSFSHFSFGYPRPLLPTVIEVGGIHIKETSPLSKDLQEFMDGSKDGVIYFALGSVMKAETLPTALRDMFIDVFSQLPQRVLWKWESDQLPGKSENVMIRKWMPQRDILAHRNVKLFIYHGGSLGLMEAIHESVPIIGIPLFGEQKMNMKVVESRGAAQTIPYEKLTSKLFLETINKVLNDKSYKENVQRMSAQFKDRPQSALESAIFWTEYVIRHNGSAHLQSPAVALPWFKYFLIDVIAVILSLIFLSIFILKRIFESLSKSSSVTFTTCCGILLCYAQGLAVNRFIQYFALSLVVICLSKQFI